MEVKKIVVEYTESEWNGIAGVLARSRPEKPEILTFNPEGTDTVVKYGHCSVCGGTVFRDQKYCPTCGQKLEWGDE